MEQPMRIHEMLDSCLTTEILSTIDSSLYRWFDLLRTDESKFLRHRKIQIELLEKIGNQLEKDLKGPLQGQDLIEVGRRVDDFLRGKGYHIKSFL